MAASESATLGDETIVRAFLEGPVCHDGNGGLRPRGRAGRCVHCPAPGLASAERCQDPVAGIPGRRRAIDAHRNRWPARAIRANAGLHARSLSGQGWPAGLCRALSRAMTGPATLMAMSPVATGRTTISA